MAFAFGLTVIEVPVCPLLHIIVPSVQPVAVIMVLSPTQISFLLQSTNGGVTSHFCVELISTLSSSSSSDFVEALPGVESGSFWSDLLTSAKFFIRPIAVTVALNLKDVEVPFARLATIPVNVPEEFISVDELTKVKPTGNLSFTSTFVAVFGPEFNTVIVYSTISPTFTTDLSTTFTKLKSAMSITGIVTVEVLFPNLVGSSFVPETTAVLVTEPILFKVPSINNTVFEPFVKFPIVQTPVPLLYPAGVELT